MGRSFPFQFYALLCGPRCPALNMKQKMPTALSWIQPLLITSTKLPLPLTRTASDWVCLLLRLPLPQSHLDRVAKVILLTSKKSIMLLLGLKPSSESPLHSEQRAESSLTMAYYTLPSRAVVQPPSPASSPPTLLPACPKATTLASLPALHHTRHALSSGPWQDLRFPLPKHVLQRTTSLTPSPFPNLHSNAVSSMRPT